MQDAMVSFDLRQTLIPFSLLQIANAFGKMKPGEEMEIYAAIDADETAIFKDILRILPPAGYDLLSQDDLAGDDPAARLRLRKRQSPTTPKPQGDSSCPKSI
jgi:TusA-related sulfurtransferase